MDWEGPSSSPDIRHFCWGISDCYQAVICWDRGLFMLPVAC